MIIRNQFLISVLNYIFFTQLAFAGGWTSGGGELIRESQNPWFLANTKQVSYCIEIDEKDFGQSKSFARQEISRAFAFWKRNLAELTFVTWGAIDLENFLRVGTQDFIETDCNAITDIRFQFGVLTKEQSDRLGDLSKTVAVSVRTDYDKTELKSKGFIYFNKDSAFPIKPWSRSQGSRLLPVIIHELGHVFGIQHNDKVAMMEDRFAEDLVRGDNQETWVDEWTTSLNNLIESFYLFSYHPSNFELIGACNVSLKPEPIPSLLNILNRVKSDDLVFNRFFGVPTGDGCLRYKLKNNEFSLNFSKMNEPVKVLGTAEVKLVDLKYADFNRWVNIVNLWLPPEQKIFCIGQPQPNPCQSWESNRIPFARFVDYQIFRGIYRSKDGKIERPLTLEVSNSGFINRMLGELDGIVYMSLEFGY